MRTVVIEAIETGVERITADALEKPKSVGRLQRQDGNFVERLRCDLPLAAHANPELRAFLRTRRFTVNESARLKVLSIFQVGRRGDLVCRIVVDDGVGDQMFFAPLATLVFDHMHPADVRFSAAETSMKNSSDYLRSHPIR
jgi:hypothetical protein